MIFPGNQLLLKTPGVQVRATPKALEHIQGALNDDLHWLRRGPSYVESTVRDKYHSDPIVMRLLDLYLQYAPDGSASDTAAADCLQPWPTA